MLKQQKTVEPNTSDVIRLANQMYERERTEQQRHSSLIAAAEEVGIPAEYMAKATEMLKSRQAEQAALSSTQATQRRSIALLLAACGAGLVLLLLGFFISIRAQAPASAVAVQAAPPQMATAQVVPTTTVDHQGLAFSYLEKGQYAAAEAEARRGIAASPNVADLHWTLGKVQFHNGDNAGALASARRAMQLNPTHTAFPLLAGEVLLAEGKKKEAIAAWEMVLQLDGGANQWDARTARRLIDGARITN